MRRFKVLAAVLIAACMVAPAFAQDAGVAKLSYGPDKWIDVHFLLQAQAYSAKTWGADSTAVPKTGTTGNYVNSESESEKDANWSKKLKIRRARLMVNAQVAKDVTFFWESDDFNRGGDNEGAATGAKEGTDKVGMFTQDAYINYKVASELQIAAGMILLPFMHHNRQSAVSLLGVDYNLTAVNIKPSNVWRDTGIEFRGLLFNGLIDYRGGVFQGVNKQVDKGDQVGKKDDINPDDNPRYTGRLQINLMDAEDGFFYSGNYLGKKKIVSFGGGADYQSKATLTYDKDKADGEKYAAKDYMAWTVDLTIDYPVGDGNVITLQGAYVNMKNRPDLGAYRTVTTGYEETAPGSGLYNTKFTSSDSFNYNGEIKEYGYFVQAGVLIMNTIQPVVKYSAWVQEKKLVDSKATVKEFTDSKQQYLTGGLNYYINGHNANIKFEYQHPMGKDQTGAKFIDQKDQKKFTLQGQIFI